MALSIDQLTDYSNKVFFEIFKEASVPDYVKQAEIDTSEIRFQLEKVAFADQTGRHFPINTPARAFVSNAFFNHKKAELKERYGASYVKKVEDNLKQAVNLFGIAEDVEKVAQVIEKTASEDYGAVKYAFEVEVEGESFELLPYKTASDLSKAAEFFAKNIEKYPFDWRTDMAHGIVKSAVEIGLDDLPEAVFKYAGLYFADPAHVKQEVVRRSYKIANAADIETYKELAKLAEEVDSAEDVLKIAAICYNVEKTAGLYDKKYTNQILGDPVLRMFNMDMGKIAELLDVIEIHGEKFKTADLQKISASIYEKAFGVEIDPMDKTALEDVLPTMPRSDVSLFKELSGVRSM